MTLRRGDAIAMAAVALALAVVAIVVGDRVDFNGGLGWDGAAYVHWARDFPGEVLHKGVTVYHAQRQLPVALVYLIDRGDPFRGFQLLDTACLVGAAILYGRIAALLAWSRAAAWGGFVAIFGSFAVARHAMYYPDLTDVTAFVLGMAMAWSYVATRPVVLAAVALAGAFTWPALPPIALALLLLPRGPMTGALSRRTSAIVAGAVALAGGVVIFHFYRHPLPIDAKWLARILRAWLPLTIALLAALVFAGTYALARTTGRPTRMNPWAGLAAIVVYAVRWWWIARVGTAGQGPTTEQFACEQAVEALRGPAWGVVHHVVYFGPIVILATLRWRRLPTLGLGAVLALVLVLAFSVGTESRQWIHLFPLFAVLTVDATKTWWTPRRLLLFGALALAWSKLWWPMATGHPGSSYEWPAMRYFMQQGPWATDGTYLAHLVAAAITTLILWRATSEA